MAREVVWGEEHCWVSIPSTYVVATVCHSSSKGSEVLFWFLQVLYAYGTQIYV